ncbi:MAG: glycosyltransferase family 4 protein [Candidatus Taylorbacteria bacterium]|nr:glycosyltransferase family 4 protein [Candidatus Taylorbacteria bacterium]
MAGISHIKKLYLIFHGRFPSEKAAALFAAKSAEAFAERGLDVMVLAPRRLGRAKQTAFDFYRLKNNFQVVFLPTVDLFKVPVLKRLAFPASFFSFSVFTFFYLLFAAKKSDIIYSNEALPILLAALAFPKTAYEIHDFPKKNFFYAAVLARVKFIIATNHWKKKKLQEIFAMAAEKILAEPNAVSLDDFLASQSKAEARSKLRLPSDAVLICYIGTLRTMGMEKGIEILLKAVKSVVSCKLLVVGGSPEDVEFYKKVASECGIIDRVIFTGFAPHPKVPLYLAAADILVAPFPKNDHYEFYMSPMKIFEYMASGRPIIASDLNSIREILPADSAVFVPPGDGSALTAAISELMADKEKVSRCAAKALAAVVEHTWPKRAERILQFIR